MSLNLRVKILAGAVALALGGTAMANTTLSSAANAPGDVFINVVDTTNGSSFLYDTGVSQATFNANQTQSYSFATDPNYTAFIAAKGASDVLDYSILSATRNNTVTPNVGTILFTSNASPSATISSNIAQAQTNINGFFTQANLVTSTTTNSVNLTALSGVTWGQNAYEVTVASNLAIPFSSAGSGDSALLGTAINFYSETSNALRSGNTFATLATLAGTWNYNNGVATYTVGQQAVPLPTPLVLLLSGLGLMGVVARRGKGTVAGTGAVAA
jgi:hypothetical protein